MDNLTRPLPGPLPPPLPPPLTLQQLRGFSSSAISLLLHTYSSKFTPSEKLYFQYIFKARISPRSITCAACLDDREEEKQRIRNKNKRRSSSSKSTEGTTKGRDEMEVPRSLCCRSYNREGSESTETQQQSNQITHLPCTQCILLNRQCIIPFDLNNEYVGEDAYVEKDSVRKMLLSLDWRKLGRRQTEEEKDVARRRLLRAIERKEMLMDEKAFPKEVRKSEGGREDLSGRISKGKTGDAETIGEESGAGYPFLPEPTNKNHPARSCPGPTNEKQPFAIKLKSTTNGADHASGPTDTPSRPTLITGAFDQEQRRDPPPDICMSGSAGAIRTGSNYGRVSDKGKHTDEAAAMTGTSAKYGAREGKPFEIAKQERGRSLVRSVRSLSRSGTWSPTPRKRTASRDALYNEEEGGIGCGRGRGDRTRSSGRAIVGRRMSRSRLPSRIGSASTLPSSTQYDLGLAQQATRMAQDDIRKGLRPLPKLYLHIICRFFRDGECNLGDACQFGHPPPPGRSPSPRSPSPMSCHQYRSLSRRYPLTLPPSQDRSGSPRRAPRLPIISQGYPTPQHRIQALGIRTRGRSASPSRGPSRFRSRSPAEARRRPDQDRVDDTRQSGSYVKNGWPSSNFGTDFARWIGKQGHENWNRAFRRYAEERWGASWESAEMPPALRILQKSIKGLEGLLNLLFIGMELKEINNQALEVSGGTRSTTAKDIGIIWNTFLSKNFQTMSAVSTAQDGIEDETAMRLGLDNRSAGTASETNLFATEDVSGQTEGNGAEDGRGDIFVARTIAKTSAETNSQAAKRWLRVQWNLGPNAAILPAHLSHRDLGGKLAHKLVILSLNGHSREEIIIGLNEICRGRMVSLPDIRTLMFRFRLRLENGKASYFSPPCDVTEASISTEEIPPEMADSKNKVTYPREAFVVGTRMIDALDSESDLQRATHEDVRQSLGEGLCEAKEGEEEIKETHEREMVIDHSPSVRVSAEGEDVELEEYTRLLCAQSASLPDFTSLSPSSLSTLSGNPGFALVFDQMKADRRWLEARLGLQGAMESLKDLG